MGSAGGSLRGWERDQGAVRPDHAAGEGGSLQRPATNQQIYESAKPRTAFQAHAREGQEARLARDPEECTRFSDKTAR
jgi:hypothetical protein